MKTHRTLTNTNFLRQRGLIRRLKNDLKGSLEDFRKAEKISPKDISILREQDETLRLMQEETLRLIQEQEIKQALVLQQEKELLSQQQQHEKQLQQHKDQLDTIDQKQSSEKRSSSPPSNNEKSEQKQKEKEKEKEPISETRRIELNAQRKRQNNQLQEALKDLNSIQMKNLSVFGLSERATIKQQLLDYKGAIEDLNRALKLTPQDIPILRQRAQCKKLAGQLHSALQDLEKGLYFHFSILIVVFVNYFVFSFKNKIAVNLNKEDVTSLRERAELKKVMGDHHAWATEMEKANQIEAKQNKQ